MNKKPTRKLSIASHTLRVLHASHLASAKGGYLRGSGGVCGGGGGDMFPHSNAYPTACLVGTGCGTLSGSCA